MRGLFLWRIGPFAWHRGRGPFSHYAVYDGEFRWYSLVGRLFLRRRWPVVQIR